MPPYVITVGSIVLASIAVVVFWTLSISRYRAGNSGPCRVWGFGAVSLLAAAIAVLVGFAFAFGMRVGQVAYWAALRFAGAEGGTAKVAKTVGIACGIALVLFLLGSGFAHQRKSKSKQ